MTPPRPRLLLTATGALLTLLVTSTAPARAQTTLGGGVPFVVAPLPQATGVTYAAGATRNEDVEPGIGVDGAGTIWVGSNLDVNTSADPRTAVAIAGEDIWKSTDGGRSFEWVAAPFQITTSNPGLGGEDSDLAVAPEKNANGFYNVYATSLYVAQSNLAISQDGGKTFTTMSVGQLPAQDRPWLSADGPCVFYLTYHQLPYFSPVVQKYDVCNPADVGLGLVITPTQSTAVFTQNSAPGLTNGFNKPAVDVSPSSPFRHTVYVPMEACNLQSPMDFLNNAVTTAEQVPACPPGVNTYTEVGVSTDGGASFQVYKVADTSNGEQQVWPTSVAVDRAGTVYVAWSDNHNAFFSKSADQGKTWSAPSRLNVAPAATAIYPTVAAGPTGEVEIAYYGSPVAGDANDAAVMKTPGAPTSAPWHLYWSRSTDGGAHFTQQQVGGVNHTGILCTMGSGCAVANSRNLYDDFGMVISPVTGRATVAFDADEPLAAAPAANLVDPFTAFATELAPGSSVATLPSGGIVVVPPGTATPSLANTGRAAAGAGALAAAAAALGGVLVAAVRRRRSRRGG